MRAAILVLECTDAAEATAALDTLPTAINDATDIVLTERSGANATTFAPIAPAAPVTGSRLPSAGRFSHC